MSKKLHLEILRIVAIFFVIFNHTGTTGFQAYIRADNDILFIIYLIIAILCKIAVPIFFMISGALLLGKEESIRDLYKNRISRIVMALVLFSFIQYLFKIKSNMGEFDFKIFFQMLYGKSIIVPYWYLYSYLSFLIILPFLRKMVKNMDKNDFIYLLGIWIMISFVMTIVENIFNISMNKNLVCILLEKSIFFPLVGYFCENYFKEFKCKSFLIYLFVFSLVCIFFSVYFTIHEMSITGDLKTQSWLGKFIAIPTIFIYVLTKYVFEKNKVNKHINSLICMVGSCTFGIYLIENQLRKLFLNEFVEISKPYLKTMPACIIGIVFSIIIGTGIVLLLKKLPIFRRIL